MISDDQRAQKSAKLLTLGLGVGLVFFCLGYFAGPQFSTVETNEPSALLKLDQQTSTSTTGDLSLLVYNYYTKDHPLSGYPWKYIAEPYRATTLEVQSPRSAATYTWEVDGHVQGSGSSVDIVFTSLGEHEVIVTETSPEHEIERTFSVMVKYVRREIRSLTDRDREAFFQAVMMLQRIPTVVGQAIYGSNYKSKDYFNRIHLYYGGTQDCDHWHQGPGFVTSHLAFTMEYEQALQSIDPSVTVPYWDFTLESTFYDAGSWMTSPVFASDWFGAADPGNDLHVVTKGRFAYVPVMANAQNFSRVYNSYGLLRAPWNNDPTPFMTRSGYVYGYHNNLKPSGCSEYDKAIQKTSWSNLAKQLNSAAHGHLHELMGGSWNQYFSDYMGGKIHPAVMTFAHEIQALSKELWRTGFVSCPKTCDMDTPASECKCECPADVLDGTGGKSAYEVLHEAGVLKSVEYFDASGHLISSWYDENGDVYYNLPGYSEEESKQIYQSLLYLLCNPGHIGSMFQATSTNDITFWLIHPTLDRLWHRSRLEMSDSFDETWDPYATCYGHNPQDLQPFSNLFGENDPDMFYYNNMDLYNLLNPANPDMPYMYDNFEWPHCEMLGYDIKP